MTNYHYCDACDKTMSQNDTIPKFEAVGVTHLCYKCLNPTAFAFSICTADQPEPSIGFCDGCDELEAKLHLMDGDWLCGTCKAAVIKAQIVGVNSRGTRHQTAAQGAAGPQNKPH